MLICTNLQFTWHISVGKLIGTAGLVTLVIIYGQVLQLAQPAISISQRHDYKACFPPKTQPSEWASKISTQEAAMQIIRGCPSSGAVMNWGKLAPPLTFQCKNQDPDTTVPTALESDTQEYYPLHPAWEKGQSSLSPAWSSFVFIIAEPLAEIVEDHYLLGN